MDRECALWFDERCSVSREVLGLVRELGIEPVLRRYLEEPPTKEELSRLLSRLGLPARDVICKGEDEYRALRLSERTPEPVLLEAMAAHPRILARPILVVGERAIVARPAERARSFVREHAAEAARERPPDDASEEEGALPTRLPMDGMLDLHTFPPSEVSRLVPDWLTACAEAGLTELRIVHGKGTGVLRRRVHSLLERDPRVLSYRLAEEDGGGWGATLISLRPLEG